METVERKNFSEFCCIVSISDSLLCDCLKIKWTVGGTSEQSTEVFSVKSPLFHYERFRLYGMFPNLAIHKCRIPVPA